MTAIPLDRVGQIFSDALIEVISTTTGLSIEVTSTEASTELDEMTGLISLYGENHGMLFISAKESVVRVLCAYMTGVIADDVTGEDAEDALCEIVNMTAGNAKLRFNNTGQVFMISPPFVFRGSDAALISKKRVNIISGLLGNEEISIKVKVVFY